MDPNNPQWAENAFTPFASGWEARRAETELVWRREILAVTHAMTIAAVLAGLAVGAAWGFVVFKSGPEYLRAIAVERPA